MDNTSFKIHKGVEGQYADVISMVRDLYYRVSASAEGYEHSTYVHAVNNLEWPIDHMMENVTGDVTQ